MLFQDALLQEIVVICIVQTWGIFFFLILAYMLLKRKKTRLTLTLSCYLILNAIGYTMSFVSILFLYAPPLAYLMYLFTLYFTVFSQSFIVIFSWLLLNLDKKISYKTYYLIIFGYISVASYVFWGAYLFDGIKYDSGSGWIPIYTVPFLIASWIYLTIFIIVPQVILTPKLLNTFEGVILKKRIKQFLISIFLEYVTIYVLILYNTWTANPILRLVFPVINFIIGPVAAYYFYKGIGKKLE
jgi:hypothetical protein